MNHEASLGQSLQADGLTAQHGERRRHHRYPVNEGTFAGVSPCMGPVVNISEGGVLFSYIDLPRQGAPSQGGHHFVICGEDGCCLDGFSYEVLSDRPLPPASPFMGPSFTRLRRLQFINLTNEQQRLLDAFIQKNAQC